MTKRALGVSALGVSALLTLAACGSSKTSVTPSAQPSAPTSTSTSSPSTSTSKPAGSSTPVVMTATTPKLGPVLVDAKGMTLYTLMNAGKPVPCTGQCASFWPPLLLPPGTMTAMGASGVSGLGTATAAGGLQVTQNGAPLYRFSIDKAPGDTNGEGISSFGGVWHAVKVGNAASIAPTTMPPVVTTPPTTAGYGYGGYSP
jgi:predicted lipoprotein with Yx(FWY)xxD motif